MLVNCPEIRLQRNRDNGAECDEITAGKRVLFHLSDRVCNSIRGPLLAGLLPQVAALLHAIKSPLQEAEAVKDTLHALAPGLYVPYPNNLQHVDNLSRLSVLKAIGFEGSDVTLAIALFEYGLAWYSDGVHVLVIYGIKLKGEEYVRFDRCVMEVGLDLRKEYNWVNWDEIYDENPGLAADMAAGPYKERPHALLTQVLQILVNRYGIENVFGTSYWDGFAIAGDQ